VRRRTDRALRYAVACGGVLVIGTVLIMLLYLVQVVLPLFERAQLEPEGSVAGTPRQVLHLAVEEYGEIAMRVLANGSVEFFRTRDGVVVAAHEAIPGGGPPLARVSPVGAAGGLLVAATANGQVLFLRHRYELRYPDGVRRIEPRLERPFGGALALAPQAPRALDAHVDEDRLLLAMAGPQPVLTVLRFRLERSLLEPQHAELSADGAQRLALPAMPVAVHVGARGSHLLVLDEEHHLSLVTVSARGDLALAARVPAAQGRRVTASAMLLGDVSLLVGDAGGSVRQWLPVRDATGGAALAEVRRLDVHAGAVTRIVPEHRRKGLVSAASDGELVLSHTTARRILARSAGTGGALSALAVSPRSELVLGADAAGRHPRWRLDARHPEVSFSNLWSPVWYEHYDEPAYVWQSSSASSDFEPKLSLVPLTVGTLKAAFYCMLVAAPLGLMGGIYTAYFCSRGARGLLKPAIEIMEALPTVILGFLAGLWLAPLVEERLPGILAALVLTGPGVLLFAAAWQRLPDGVRGRVPPGWEAVALLPVVVALVAAAMSLDEPLERMLFGGDTRRWLTTVAGIDFDQRNAIVVGIAMGFAVIPTIFSITDDAVFGVPRHLSDGSLALGASRWMTLARVIVPTASPGLFSALMLGLGRAVGETMIVLMATGNTPILDPSPFQGMRTLSANIAVEMPESAVGSTHFRVLYLSALVLFLFTLIFNTAAELVRQRMRRRYQAL